MKMMALNNILSQLIISLVFLIFIHIIRTCTEQHYRFIKIRPPDDETERAKVAMTLMNYNVSLIQYSQSLEQPEIRT